MASPTNGFPAGWSEEWLREAVRQANAFETELEKAMKRGVARRRFIRSLFPADWKISDDQYSFHEGRAILIVTPPSR